mgnify:CR=1 FL=1
MYLDRVYPFGINVNYRTYPDAGVIETWVDAVNNGKKDVELREFASGYLPVRSGDVYLTSFYGSWANEARMEEEPLTHGMKIIKNKDGLRNTHTAHPEVMFTAFALLRVCQSERGRGECFAFGEDVCRVVLVDTCKEMMIVGIVGIYAQPRRQGPQRRNRFRYMDRAGDDKLRKRTLRGSS